VHGFDEFYGNLYHRNAEEEPENADYPKDPAFRQNFGPRGVLDCVATDTFDDTDQPRWGVVGKQKIKDTGPLTKSGWKTLRKTCSTVPSISWSVRSRKTRKLEDPGFGVRGPGIALKTKR
jgi:arylsulfatase A-like enzyme